MKKAEINEFYKLKNMKYGKEKKVGKIDPLAEGIGMTGHDNVEKPRDFDPFGQAGLSPLATI